MIKVTQANKKLHTTIDFVLKAVGKNENRYFMNGVYFDEEENSKVAVVGTDGVRLHRVILDNGDISEGIELKNIYFVTKAGKDFILETKKDIKKYPNYKRVIPEASALREIDTVDVHSNKTKQSREARAIIISKIFFLFAKKEYALNYLYLEGIPNGRATLFCQEDRQKAIKIDTYDSNTSLTFEIVIMTLRAEQVG